MFGLLRLLGKNTVGRISGSIAAKLYCFALLSVVAIFTLASSSIYLAKTTETAAHRLYDHGFLGTQSSARLGLLLEQHRRLIDSMSSEVDRTAIDHDRQELDAIQSKMADLINE